MDWKSRFLGDYRRLWLCEIIEAKTTATKLIWITASSVSADGMSPLDAQIFAGKWRSNSGPLCKWEADIWMRKMWERYQPLVLIYPLQLTHTQITNTVGSMLISGALIIRIKYIPLAVLVRYFLPNSKGFRWSSKQSISAIHWKRCALYYIEIKSSSIKEVYPPVTYWGHISCQVNLHDVAKHDDVIKMETLSALLCLCGGNSPVTGEFPHKGQRRGGLMFSLICAGINGWINNRGAGDLRRHHPHYDVTVMHFVIVLINRHNEIDLLIILTSTMKSMEPKGKLIKWLTSVLFW